MTRALYRSVVELDNEALLHAFAARVDAATTAMLATAPDASLADAGAVNLTLTSVIYGTVRNAFERGLLAKDTDALRRNLHAMCRAYLETLPQHCAADVATVADIGKGMARQPAPASASAHAATQRGNS